MSIKIEEWMFIIFLIAGTFAETEINQACVADPEALDCIQPSNKPFSQYMWDNSLLIAKKALNTPFVQGLRHGTLLPTKFGAYVVQDAVYLEKISDTLWTAYENLNVSTEVDLREFFIREAQNYMRYANDMYKEWQLSGSSCVTLGSGCQAYVDYKMKVAKAMEPIYTIVSMIPCARLWPWIGAELDKVQHDFGVYKKWVNVNFDPNYDGYKKLEEWVDKFYNERLLDGRKALEVYKNCMNGEFLFFNGAFP